MKISVSKIEAESPLPAGLMNWGVVLGIVTLWLKELGIVIVGVLFGLTVAEPAATLRRETNAAI
ncbi:MAG: hypothetical protein M1587_06870 [Thaumarchaeota archaeon]|nr:hypothetical protein [Nitrososphaerota archaeon]MCL5068185.1 hypothetical protein [Nitrososphaerota archaeon]MDG6906977.1 hypothetical protein [Nitrososphaerota archaeon]